MITFTAAPCESAEEKAFLQISADLYAEGIITKYFVVMQCW